MSLHCWQTVAPVGLNQLSDSEHQPRPQEQRQALRLIWHSDRTVWLPHTGQEGPFPIGLHCKGSCCETLHHEPRNMIWIPFHLVWSHFEKSRRAALNYFIPTQVSGVSCVSRTLLLKMRVSFTHSKSNFSSFMRHWAAVKGWTWALIDGTNALYGHLLFVEVFFFFFFLNRVFKEREIRRANMSGAPTQAQGALWPWRGEATKKTVWISDFSVKSWYEL